MVERRLIPGFSQYEISSDGEIFRVGSNSPRKPQYNNKGYLKIRLRSDDGTHRSILISRTVCLAFHGDPPSKDMHAAHHNSIKSDNRKDNVGWKTQAQNEADKVDVGTANRCARNGRAKLTPSQILEIRASADDVTSISKQYGISISTTSLIKNRKLWSTLKDLP